MQRRTNTLIALVLAGLAAILTAVSVGSAGDKSAPKSALGTVWVARADIPAGTPGGAIFKGLAVRRAVAVDALVPSAVVSPSALRGLVSTQPILAGEQISLRRFAPSSGNATLGGLRGKARAITISGEPYQVLAGTLKDGDRVDVLASMTYPEGSGRHFSAVVLRGLTVLRAPDADTSNSTAAATLALTDAQAQRLFYVVKNADWSLVLRPAVRASDSRVGGVDAGAVLREAR
jgi:Flp pilus assembly protein CpaB